MRRRYPGLDLEAESEEDDDLRSRERPETTTELVRSTLTPSLFDYQRDLAEQILEAIANRENALVALPTGAGKTRTAVFALLAAAANNQTSRVAWLAPSIELLDQAQAAVEKLWRDYGDAPDLLLTRKTAPQETNGLSSVVFLTPQRAYARRQQQLGDWDAIIFDEAHQLGARTFRRAMESMREGSQRPAVFVGLSATPGRVDPSETEDLIDWFGGRLLRSRSLRPNPVKVLQRRGILARLGFKDIAIPSDAPNAIVHQVAIVELCAELSRREKRTLVFTASVQDANLVAAALRSEGIRAAAVSSKTPTPVRTSRIDAFAAGRIDVLANQRLLATGYDCPAVSNVVLGTRIGSPILFEQMVGRAARGARTGGTSKAQVWQFDDHLALHGLPQSYYRYSDFDWK